MAGIQGKIIKHGKQNIVSRLVHAKNDKKTIATWRLDLNRILLVFNVRPVVFLWLLLNIHIQTELAINTHVIVPGIHHEVTNAQTIVPDTHSGVADTRGPVSDVHCGVANTHPIVSELHDNVADTHTTVNAAIEAMDLAKRLSTVTPAKDVFGTVSVSLTMLRVSPFCFFLTDSRLECA